MRTLHPLLFTSFTALCCVTWAADLIQLFGYEGRDVHISCSYGQGYEDYEKYLCKDSCGTSDVLIKTSQPNTSKYSIYDDKEAKVFRTTVSGLRSMDAGEYWCGVSRNGKDIYTEINLQIKQDSCCDKVSEIRGSEEGSVSISCLYESKYEKNMKYICRGRQPSTCLQQALITSDNKLNKRFTLSDDKMSKTFTVTISNLTLKDAGSYLCGIQRDEGLDVFSAVQLEVKEWCCVTSANIKGTLGLPLTFNCSYPSEHNNNRRFICKGVQRSSCKDMMMGQNRFTLNDDSFNSFSVTIAKLEAGDAGTYWCRFESEWVVGNYTQFHLSIQKSNKETSTVKTVKNSAHAPVKSIKDEVLYAASAVAAVVLLVLMLVLVAVCRHKRSKNKEPVGDKLEAVPSQILATAEDIYENHDANIKRSQKSTGSDCEDADYETVTSSEDIYCNERFHKTPNVKH